MNNAAKITGFVAGLAAVFGVAAGAGYAVGPLDTEPSTRHGTEHSATSESDHGVGGDGGHGAQAATSTRAAELLPGGLMVSQNGYALHPDRASYHPGEEVPVSFTITGPDGAPVTEYEKAHEKDLHLIAIRRDLTGYQHVHPVLDRDTGRWSTSLRFTPGEWRLFADFTASGADPVTLGVDVSVPGRYEPTAPPTPSRTTRVAGYEVTLDGDLSPGSESVVTARVTRDGEPVTDLQPYLGAYGHLVALRDGDLAYLHVHPDGHPGDGRTKPGPEVTFFATVPSSADYRLFFDFKHEGEVHTASFPLSTTGRDQAAGDGPSEGEKGKTEPSGGHGDHAH